MEELNMAYNENGLTKLAALQDLAEQIAADYATKAALKQVSDRVEEIATVGGEPNVITAVKNNGEALPVADKAVDIGASISAAVAAADHLQRKKVASVDDIDPAAQGADRFIYMVPKAGGKNGDKFDEYMIIDGAVEPVGDWAVDLSGYQPKEEGKGLSSNDYTSEEKAKLAGLTVATDAEVAEMLAEVFGQKQA
jgi:hypothetical protein